MKRCCKCKKEKEIGEFNKNKTRKDGYNTICRECSNAHSRAYFANGYYSQNKDKFRASKQRSKQRIREYLDSLDLSCRKCGYYHPEVIDFHHVKPEEKEITIYRARQLGWSIERFKKELDKCIPLCANCHRKLHYEERHS